MNEKKSKLNRRDFLKMSALSAISFGAGLASLRCAQKTHDHPNFVIIFCDDLGYGDLGTFGHPTIKTPNLDRMAQEGQKWTNFYVAASVCTPSRAGLMTGRLPIRNGMCSDKRRVLFPDSAGGLPESEITIAALLKKAGYKTGCVGKWHLGHLPQYLPTNHGFDSYFGIPYSNDMDKEKDLTWDEFNMDPKSEYFNVPLMRDDKIIERPAEQTTLTKRYTEETIKFIKQNKNEPFFVYLAHTMPHIPLFRSKQFTGKSLRGLYGDVIEEIDWSVGQILESLRQEKLDKNTFVVFTSDNGPWLLFKQQGGSAGLLRAGKGTTWEGGMREPTIFWWQGTIQPGVIMDLGSTLDLFPTLCGLAGAKIPDDRVMDGYDLRPVLQGTGPSPRKVMIYYRGEKVFAIRKGAYKAHFITRPAYTGKGEKATEHDPPLLYNLEHDPSEKYNISDQHPDIIADIRRELEQHLATLQPVENELKKRMKNM